MRKALLLLLCVTSLVSRAQLIISNPSFEDMVECPTTLSMVALAEHWQSVVESPDYYNCGFTSEVFPTGSAASEGTGYACFASYAISNGAAEAIGQNLVVPASAGNYTLLLDVKRANGGTYSSDCGGVSIYGIADTLPLAYTGVHPADIAGTVLLGTTSLVNNVEWEQRTVTLQLPTTMQSIIFTTEVTPNCGEAIFIDNLSTHGTPTSIQENSTDAIGIHPNPAVDRAMLTLPANAGLVRWTVLDATGRTRAEGASAGSSANMDVHALVQGTYVVRWIAVDGTSGTQRLVKTAQ